MVQHMRASYVILRKLIAVTEMPGLVTFTDTVKLLALHAQVQAGERTFKMAMLHTKGRSPGSSPLQKSPTNCTWTSNTGIGIFCSRYFAFARSLLSRDTLPDSGLC